MKNNKSFLNSLLKELPHLKDCLELNKIVYKKKRNRIYFLFSSCQLIGEKDYLRILKMLKVRYHDASVALRIASPNLAEDFLKNISNYKAVLIDFLARTYPSSKSWISSIDWEITSGIIILTFPDDFSIDYMRKNKISERLSKAIWNIFSIEVPIELRIKGNQESRIAALKKEREDSLLKEQEALIKKVNINPESCKVSFSRKSKRSSIICGRNILTDPIPISEVNLDLDVATIEGEIISLESRELKNGETLLVILAVTDYTSTITCKMFLRYRRNGQDNNHESPSISPAEKARVEKIVNMLSEGSFVKIRGRCVYDTYADEVSLMIQDIIAVKKEERLDTAPLKRVELHMHTHMSAMDALSSPEVLIERAASWGHTAVAITDHGVLQAFPAAFSAAKKHSIKLLPGLEAYMIKENIVVENCKNISLNKPIVVIDFETTGLNTKTDKIIEIGAVKLDGDKIVETFSELINPHISLPSKITKITGITDAMLNGKPSIEQVMPDFLKFVGNCPIAAHNASFDMGMLESELERQSITLDVAQIDTLALSRKLYPMLKSHRLKSLCRHLNVSLQNAHRAFDDARATAQCLSKMIEEVERLGACTLPEIDQLIQGGVIGQRFHIILLAITQKGLTNLNRLVSDAHINHFQKFPHLPRTLIEKYREGLLIGSACEAGELYQAVLNKQPDSELEKIAGFYDYLEIQPTSNNAFLIKNGMVTSEKELEEHNKKIVSLGSLLDIPVVATGDVHFLDPKDAIGRSIIQSGLGYSDSDEQPPLYFKTTQEMLKDFAYLGEEKAKEVVITNTQKIAARAEDLSLFPIHPEGKSTFQPLWTDAADKIKTMSVKRAKDIYGQNLPDIVDTRLNKELKSIIGNGFATLYMIAHKLALKSLQDGYVVGSRGSVGSSFVATMCDITEVNPLGPHYVCTNCKYSDFDVDKKAFKVGVDLPDKLCPNCSTMLHKEGFDIPFEVFLGFKGDKVPDIDLNFPSSYQPIAHTFVENLFPKGHVYRAGTISTLKKKTAFGFVSKYLEERELSVSNAEKERLVQMCVGVKRTTGQHPGGMVVVPNEYEVYQFTAIQHPADDKDTGVITTHFDFKSMHDILIKLDVLGHDDPTMIHMLGRLTGVDYKDIPLNDPKVMSLFKSPDILCVEQEDIRCSTGTYGIPEFGTPFVRQMLEDTKPSTMEELIRISGLSHGTDVWLGNAKDLIATGVATLSQCICTREDIMSSLIGYGLDNKSSFDIMERVRKGGSLTNDMEKMMLKHNVPQWFIDSCKKIKYMFPKGHAVAYVMMALRIAWFKIYHPLAYYAAYFTIRGNGFDSTRMLLSANVIQSLLDNAENSQNKNRSGSKTALSAKEKEEIVTLEVVLEMLHRGYDFLPIDLYKSHITEFLIEGNSLRVPLTSVNGLGITVANAIDETRDIPFISIEDLKNRTKISSTVIETLRSLGSLEGLSDTSQVDLFSLL